MWIKGRLFPLFKQVGKFSLSLFRFPEFPPEESNLFRWVYCNARLHSAFFFIHYSVYSINKAQICHFVRKRRDFAQLKPFSCASGGFRRTISRRIVLQLLSNDAVNETPPSPDSRRTGGSYRYTYRSPGGGKKQQAILLPRCSCIISNILGAFALPPLLWRLCQYQSCLHVRAMLFF